MQMEDIYSSSNKGPNRKRDDGSRDISSSSGQRPKRPAQPPNPDSNHRPPQRPAQQSQHNQPPRRPTPAKPADATQDFTPVRPPAQNPYDRRPPQQQRPQQGGGPGQPMEDIKSGRQKRRRKKHVLLKIFLALIALILAAALAVGSYVYRLMGSFDYNEAGHKNNVYVDESKLFGSKDVTNILFMGVDRRNADENSRSDTMMLLSIDRANKKLKLTSFLRDSWVYIPDNGYAKLNASCAWGGAQLVMDTLEYNFNVKIDHYMLVDFEMFQNIVNKLGGITVAVTEKEARYMRDDVHLNIQAGENVRLDGNEALWYCRIRYLDSDFMRTQRQRKVLSAVIDKAKSTPIPTLIELVREILPDVETDIRQSELMKLAAGTALSYMRYDVEQMRIPADGTWKSKTIKGQSALSLDIEENQQQLYDFLYTKDAENTTRKSAASE